MTILQVFAALSVIFTVIAGPSYFFDILKRRAKPQRITWLIFSIIGTVAFISQLQLGGRLSDIFVGVDAIGSISTFVLSLFYGVGGWETHDKIAIAFAAIGIIISLLAHQPLFALTGAILADISATSLTVVKTYRDPASETMLVWILIAIAALCSALAVGKFQLNLLLFPGYLIAANLAIVVAKILGTRVQKVEG